jgi:hypothetical protein
MNRILVALLVAVSSAGFAQTSPSEPVQRANWLPAPKEQGFSLVIRAYWR